ncbi:MAG TPA: RNA-binding protein [Candidatus Polarisedimenticolia bacterium]|jgi:RNA recognition motif-containing protein|nr:RNA-binding protein [Candidatus Polarisedimenticolia bacterium]
MGTRLFVGNLSFDVSDDDLRQAFSEAGSCSSASIVRDRMTGKSRGFGFVEMTTEQEAQRAVSTLNGRDLQGRAMNVSEARERGADRGPSRPPSFRSFGPPMGGGEPPPFRKEGGSRRGLRAKKRSL